MKDHVARFPAQLQEALQIAESARLTLHDGIQHVVISGLGGSGIGGTLIAELSATECTVPVIVNKDYFLPAFVNAHTLVIISSYSGNTEETISAINEAIAKKAKVACITSGGKIAEIAAQHHFDCIKVPGGNPPRTCLGYSLVQLFRILSHNKLIGESYREELKATIALLNTEQQQIREEAKKGAQQLNGKIAVIYSMGNTEGIAVRFRQQINENSKMLCWHNVIPEMNHNELVGWTSKNENLAVVTLRTSHDYSRNIRRLEVCKEVLKRYTSTFVEINAKGKSKLEQAIYLIHLTDWMSCYLADLKQIDPVEVKVIDHLKAELAKL
ncbi:MAG: bifunctional phosphoglucose/phosphomannose isomerase [Bacteroidia bacterium]